MFKPVLIAATLILARFVPFVRTFAPIAAGAAKIHYAKFVIWNAIGAVVWADGIILLGVWLGKIDWVRTHIDMIFIGIVLVSVLPIALGAAKKFLAGRRSDAAA